MSFKGLDINENSSLSVSNVYVNNLSFKTDADVFVLDAFYSLLNNLSVVISNLVMSNIYCQSDGKLIWDQF